MDSLIRPALDSLLQDRVDSIFPGFQRRPAIRLSPDSLPDKVVYGSKDSSFLDVSNQVYHLYGNAFVRYKNLELTANYIQFDLRSNIATAEAWPDSSGRLTGKPVFTEGDQSFVSNRLRYNFKTRTGKIYDVTTEEGDLNVHGTATKFYGKGSVLGGNDNVIFNQGALFTTCDHPEPHFGVSSSKQKIVTDKVAVVGFSHVEIGGVPTPLVLPFGFFPLKQGQRAGILFPRDYEYSPARGFGLRNVGYYFPINDHMDAELSGDIYMRGSFGLQALTRYRKRYKYNGRIQIAYSRYIEELDNGIDKDIQKSFRLRINHNQDSKAHPSITIGGSINMQSNQYNSLNHNDVENVLNNQLSSNFSFRHSMPGTPFNFSAALTHSQNTQTRQINLSLPKLDLQMKRIYPFKRKKPVGPERWYEKLSLNYNSSLQNKVTAVDTALFTEETWQDAMFGVKHNADMDLNLRVLKYFNLAPFIRLEETWYSKTTSKEFVFDPFIEMDTIYNSDSSNFELVIDTLSYGHVVQSRNAGFKASHEFNTGISLNTQVFGTFQFRKGWLRGLRHVLKPSISLNYQPDYTRSSLGYYDSYQFINDNGELQEEEYSVFEDEVYSGPGSSGEVFGLNYSFTNLFEAKVFNKRDSSEKKVKLFDNIRLGGGYNFAADSLRFSQINISGNARFFQGITTFSIAMRYDPYAINNEGLRINQYYWSTNRKPLRFVQANYRFSTGLTVKKFRELLDGKKKEKDTPAGLFEGDVTKIFDGIRISHNLSIRTNVVDEKKHTMVTTNSISLRGRIPLSSKWNLNVSNIDYNFINKRFNYPDLGLSRDLHCWEMGINWQPRRGTYSFYLRVKPGSLDFLKLPYTKNRSDAFQEF